MLVNIFFLWKMSISIKELKLSAVDETLIKTGTFLKEVAMEKEKLDCLKAFTECSPIVKWLKSTTVGRLL